MSFQPFTGQVMLIAGNYAPRGWLLCRGQSLAVSSYSALFSLIGTNYGGDGRTFFNLPDLRDRVPIGASKSGKFRDGETGGNGSVKIGEQQIPNHQHDPEFYVALDISDESLPKPGNSRAAVCAHNAGTHEFQNSFATNTPDVSLHPDTITSNVKGNGEDLSVMQPYLAINYAICVFGIYPSQ
ncbi:MAG: tail fiber protein [Gilvibacter sp.]